MEATREENEKLQAAFDKHKDEAQEVMDKAVSEVVSKFTKEVNALRDENQTQSEQLSIAKEEIEMHLSAECTPACNARFEKKMCASSQPLLAPLSWDPVILCNRPIPTPSRAEIENLLQTLKDAKLEATIQKRKVAEWRRQHKHLIKSLQDAVNVTHKLPRPERDQRFWSLVSKEVKYANEQMSNLTRPMLVQKNASQLAKELADSERNNEDMGLKLENTLAKYEKLKKEHSIAIQRLKWHSQSLMQQQALRGELWTTTEDIVRATGKIEADALPASRSLAAPFPFNMPAQRNTP